VEDVLIPRVSGEMDPVGIVGRGGEAGHGEHVHDTERGLDESRGE